jgi:protein-tyrosine phosphatase
MIDTRACRGSRPARLPCRKVFALVSGEHVTDVSRCTVLCVCTGNICRSPAAARMLAARLGPSVAVGSAGFRALIGRPISRPMADRLEAAGFDSADFAARQLLTSMIRSADLVITMTRRQRAEIGRLAPPVAGRTFTLLEFARLVGGLAPDDLPEADPAERLMAAIRVAGLLRRPVIGREDVADPFGRPARAYDRAFDAIDRATLAIADLVVSDRDATRDPTRTQTGT